MEKKSDLDIESFQGLPSLHSDVEFRKSALSNLFKPTFPLAVVQKGPGYHIWIHRSERFLLQLVRFITFV